MKVEFHHLRARARSAIAHPQSHSYGLAGRSLVRRHFQIAVIELRIGKTVTEWEQRLYIALVEISVADVDTFGVIDLKIFARIVSVGRRIFPLLHKRNGKLSGRIGVAE